MSKILRNLFKSLRPVSEEERYLNNSKDLFDLEQRMKRLAYLRNRGFYI